MEKKICPYCGNDVFEATQVRTVAVMVDGSCNLLNDMRCLSDEPISGPFRCRGCGTEYSSLSNLINGPYYKSVVITNHFKDFEKYFTEYGIGRPRVTRDKLDEVVVSIVKKLAESDMKMNGYYCYYSQAYAGDDDVSGVLLIDRSDNDINIKLTEYKPQG